jgi:hypothetical protein
MVHKLFKIVTVYVLFGRLARDNFVLDWHFFHLLSLLLDFFQLLLEFETLNLDTLLLLDERDYFNSFGLMDLWDLFKLVPRLIFEG